MTSEPGLRRESSAAAVPVKANAAMLPPISSDTALPMEERMVMAIPLDYERRHWSAPWHRKVKQPCCTKMNARLMKIDIGLSTSRVPLPATAWLMISGLGGLGALTRRKRGA